MKHRPMALTIALNSALMIFSVYLLMQTFVYFRDGILMGTGDMSDFIPVVFGFLGNRVLPPMVVFGIILWALARPIEKVWNRLEKGEILTPEEAEKVRIRILRFKFIVLGINIFGFTIGFILNLVFSGNLNSVTQLNYVMILVSNLTGAFVFSAAQTALNNVVFAPVRDKLNIFAIQGRKKDAPSTTRQLRLSLALVVYSLLVVQYNQYDVTLFQSWGQEILQQVQTGSLSAPEAEKAYREIIQSRFSLISMRSPDLAAASPLPWEGAMPGPVKQQMVFLLLGMMMGMISLSVQYAVSREQRSTILALHGRIKDVVEGQGDLKSRISLRSLDDMGELGEMVNRLLDQFRSMVTTIAGAARQTRSSSRSVEEVLVEAENVAHQVGEAVTSLRQELEAQVTQSQNLTQTLLAFRNSAVEVEAETSVQDQYLTQTAAAMAEMDSNIVQVRDSSREAENLTKTLADQGLAGGEAVKATSQAIQNVLTSSSEIQQFLTVLNQIAANTNLLAMNAAIEAAHAGEKGAGFAVVADEVRKLAQTSGVQTKSIKELLKNMARLVEGGVEKARISGSVLEDLVQGLQDSAQVSRKVSESMEEQTSRTREVASSLDQVVRAGQSISRKVTRQLETTRDMEESLTRAVGKLNILTEGSIRQSQAMGTLDRTFLQVRKEVEANAKAAESLEKELSRFQV